MENVALLLLNDEWRTQMRLDFVKIKQMIFQIDILYLFDTKWQKLISGQDPSCPAYATGHIVFLAKYNLLHFWVQTFKIQANIDE